MTAQGQVTMDVEAPLREVTRDDRCPHLAMLLHTLAEVPAALASFYALGVKRNGWVLHRALPGHGARDRADLIAAGLDVPRLEREGRLHLDELPIDEGPDSWAQPWLAVLEEQLARGFDSVWWSRFPIGPSALEFQVALQYDRAWEAAFHGRRAVSLCLYIVGELPTEVRRERAATLAGVHDGVLVAEPDGVDVLPRRARLQR